ncbi:hypothetical protein KDL29_13170 [bacterium]|nr:hypothetical protein [bacterium]
MKLVIICGLLLATQICSPALAQYELNPLDTPAALPIPVGMGLLANETDFLQRFPDEDSRPDFLLRYHPAAHVKFGWDGMDGLGGYRAEEHLLDGPQGNPIVGNPDERYESLEIAVYGIAKGYLELYDTSSGQPELLQTLEFPPVSAEYVWLLDLTGDGRSELVVSGMSGISYGGGAYVFRMTDDRRLEPVMEDISGESWPQQIWSFYGSLDLLHTPDGKWVFRGIAPIGGRLSDYFWSYFYEWDESLGRFSMEGPSYRQQKREQQDFFRNFQRVLKDFKASPEVFAIKGSGKPASYGFKYLNRDYSLDVFRDEDGSIVEMLLDETINELEYFLDPSLLD